jgi:hypothetical protein
MEESKTHVAATKHGAGAPFGAARAKPLRCFAVADAVFPRAQHGGRAGAGASMQFRGAALPQARPGLET